jgi:hypothetical protein
MQTEKEIAIIKSSFNDNPHNKSGQKVDLYPSLDGKSYEVFWLLEKSLVLENLQRDKLGRGSLFRSHL